MNKNVKEYDDASRPRPSGGLGFDDDVDGVAAATVVAVVLLLSLIATGC